MKPFGFPRRQRILKRNSFQKVQAEGRKVVTRYFVFLVRPNDLGWPRLGLTVSRKVGGAVVRNRVKRILREAFRQERPFDGLGMDIVAIPRRELPIPAPYRLAADSLAELVRHIEGPRGI